LVWNNYANQVVANGSGKTPDQFANGAKHFEILPAVAHDLKKIYFVGFPGNSPQGVPCGCGDFCCLRNGMGAEFFVVLFHRDS
jgi:hypothetical protein